jgi:hypothetical protein
MIGLRRGVLRRVADRVATWTGQGLLQALALEGHGSASVRVGGGWTARWRSFPDGSAAPD